MEKQFSSQDKERYWYNYWIEERIFEKCSQRPSEQAYCIMIPPPNVTGSLHMGHAFQDTLMDILIRHEALRGSKVLWQVGTDHAGIATQMVVDRLLESDGICPKSLSREERLSRIWDWKTLSGGTILSQLKRLGTAIDWNRERFTLDSQYQNSVQTAFVKLYHDGLVTKKKRLVNWDCYLKSAVSDLEVDNIETEGFLYVLKYPIKNSSDFLSVATTRPETIFGDVAVAVHPGDLRYQHLIGQFLVLPIINREIPIISDFRITPEFGTGCVKITPAHDFFDFEVAGDASLPLLNILNSDGTLNEHCAQFQGIDRLKARDLVLEALQNNNLLLETLPHSSSIPFCSRTNQRIEPYLTDQWYITMQPLADRALQSFYNKDFSFIPTAWGTNYEQWLTGIQDWCISRQMIWGHRIPAWTDDQGTIYVEETEAKVRNLYNLPQNLPLSQDEDVLDTWFSSALWPFATLGWPNANFFEKSPFFPTSVLVSGFDIIFFWVARMVMFSIYFTGKIPFKHVYLHGIVQDSKGQKMSKSKGNVIDPIDLIDGISFENLLKKRTAGLMQPAMKKQIAEQTQKEFPEGFPSFGVDPLRMAFAHQGSPGRFIRFDFKRLHIQQQTCHKLWNLMRFSQPHLLASLPEEIPEHPFNQWILSQLSTINEITSNHLKDYRFDLYIQDLVDFMWSDVCDRYVELCKVLFTMPEVMMETQRTLTKVLQGLLTLLHPTIPFITEELNSILHTAISPNTSYRCLLEENISLNLSFEPYFSLERKSDIEAFFSLLKGIRTVRSKLDISPRVIIPISFQKSCAAFDSFEKFFEVIGKVNRFSQNEETFKKLHCVEGSQAYILFMPLASAEERLARFVLDREKLLLEKERIELRLNKPGFKNQAPSSIVEKDLARILELTQQIEGIKDSISQLS